MKDRCTNDKSMLDRKTFPTILLKIEKEAIKKRKMVRRRASMNKLLIEYLNILILIS